jgi:CheY-like chemotaxis protein
LDTKRKVEGAGLGLSITQSLVNLMNGYINVKSEPGCGSAFTVRLPQKLNGPRSVMSRELAENLNQRRVIDAGQVKSAQILRKYMPYGRVLIVDDTEANLYVAKLLMMPYGLKIETASNGYEAIDLIKAGNVYDMIFMDHMMPMLDGIDTVKLIRGMGYVEPIVALTANALVGQADIFLANGFDDFISKPMDMRILDISLNKYIYDKQSPDVLAAAALEREMAGAVTQQIKDRESELPGFDIRGLNIRQGLAFCDDDQDTYLSALRSFTQSVPDILDKLRVVTKETLTDYAINVHGLKSISGWISADGIQARAASLEALAKAEDFDGVMTLNKNFVDDIETFISELRVEIKKY